MSAAPVFLHVGLTKTGTSFLQGMAFGSPAQLAAQGVRLVPAGKRATFELMLDVRGRVDPAIDRPRAVTALERLPAQLAEVPGARVLITQESLAAATADQAAHLHAALAGHEVHLVLTVREIARQMASAWQQSVKSRAGVGFPDYVTAVVNRSGPGAGRFWLAQDVLAVLDRWSAALPPERVHVVTVPHPGAPPDTLARRFFGLLGVDAGSLSTAGVFANPSIGRVQGELLARLNRRLPLGHHRRDVYGDVVKRLFAQRVLAGQAGDPPRVPERWRGWCEERSAEIVEAIRGRGYDVVGDLDDLRPAESSFGADITAPGSEELLDVAEQALADILDGLMVEREERRRRAPAAAPAPRLSPPGLAARLGRVLRRA